MYPFERFTADAKQALLFAQEEAARSNHLYIGTEHLLLGLLRLTSGTAHQVLRELGVEQEAVQKMVVSLLGRNERIVVRQIIPTTRVKKVIEIAFEEARRVGTSMVDSGLLLMAISLEGEGIAAHVLQDLGADTQRVVSAVRLALEVQGVDQREFTRRPPADISEVTVLQHLFEIPHVADLLRARGLDVEELANELLDPPEDVRRLRRKLVVLRAELNAADRAGDKERLLKLATEAAEVGAELQQAESRWLETLRR